MTVKIHVQLLEQIVGIKQDANDKKRQFFSIKDCGGKENRYLNEADRPNDDIYDDFK